LPRKLSRTRHETNIFDPVSYPVRKMFAIQSATMPSQKQAGNQLSGQYPTSFSTKNNITCDWH